MSDCLCVGSGIRVSRLSATDRDRNVWPEPDRTLAAPALRRNGRAGPEALPHSAYADGS